MCKSVPVALFYSYNKNYATKGVVTKINIKFLPGFYSKYIHKLCKTVLKRWFYAFPDV